MKKNWYNILFFCISCLPVLPIYAQNVLDGVYEKHHNKTRKVIPYASLREADVMWTKRIWREMDLNEKINLPFMYPGGLFMDIIYNSIEAGELTAYKDEGFKELKSWEEIKKEISSTKMTQVIDPVTGEEKEVETVSEIDKERDIRMIRIKEDWFFDKQRSVIEPRIIAIAPLYTKYNDADEEMLKLPFCWIYYPELRYIIANTEVFNRANDAARLSFLDIFDKRMFSSYITKESNVYDRKITDYVIGKEATLEAERIKNEIIVYEHDLWHY